MSSPTVPGPRPWNLSDDILVVVSRMAAASIFGRADNGTAGAGSAPTCVGGGVVAGAFSWAGSEPPHAAARTAVKALAVRN
jgi:hypothetical protein